MRSRRILVAFAGTTQSVLFEHENKNGFTFGYTDNYLRVRAPFDASLSGEIITTELGMLGDDGVFIGSISQKIKA